MKPQDLIIPFSWDERRPCLLDRLLFIPSYYTDYESWKKLFSLTEIFPNNNNAIIEYCSGNGQWIIDKAKNHPESNWIAVEKRFDRARKIWCKMKNDNISNLFVVMGEAYTFTKYFVDSNSIDTVYINFPDPWPKKKHLKHRLIHKDFVDELSRAMPLQAMVVIATDDLDATNRMKEFFIDHKGFMSTLPPPYYTNKWEGYGSSFFDDLWRQKGRSIQYLQFESCCE